MEFERKTSCKSWQLPGGGDGKEKVHDFRTAGTFSKGGQ